MAYRLQTPKVNEFLLRFLKITLRCGVFFVFIRLSRILGHLFL